MIPACDLWMLGLRPLRGDEAFDVHPPVARRPPEARVFPDMGLRRAERLSVGVACSLHWGPGRRLLAAFRAAHPDVEIILHDLPEAELEPRFGRGELDVAIAPDKAAPAGWRTRRLSRERLIVALPESSPLTRGNAVAPNDLRNEILLLAGDDAGQPAFHRAVTGALGGAPKIVAHHPVERDTLLDLVALGVGITLCPGSMTGAFYPGVCFRPIESDAAEIGYSLMWPATSANAARDRFVALADTLPKACADVRA